MSWSVNIREKCAPVLNAFSRGSISPCIVRPEVRCHGWWFCSIKEVSELRQSGCPSRVEHPQRWQKIRRRQYKRDNLGEITVTTLVLISPSYPYFKHHFLRSCHVSSLTSLIFLSPSAALALSGAMSKAFSNIPLDLDR